MSDATMTTMGGGVDVSRREFVAVLGAGILIAVAPDEADGQEQRRRGGGGGGGIRGDESDRPISTRVHIGKDGAITVMVGKVECGQGARGELTQAAAEELRVPPGQVALVMADTDLAPDDGMTAGSRSTPQTVPAVRRGCAAAREVLVAAAAKKWGVEAGSVAVSEGAARSGERTLSYAELAGDEELGRGLGAVAPREIALTKVGEWKVMGADFGRPNARDIVTGRHQYPSDITREGTWRGKVLRAPSYGAKLLSIDVAAAKAASPEAIVVREDGFVGVVAPTDRAADAAVKTLAKSARWDEPEQPVSSANVFEHLRKTAQVPANPFADELAKCVKQYKRTFHVPYAQHAPMEPRAAAAEWSADGKVTVWMGTQNPFGCRNEIQRALGVAGDKVRVIVPDFGGGFGGKHSAEHGVEAARLARGAGRPVSLRWTRAEEFTWAAFRPAAVIDVEAGLDGNGKIANWWMVNVNSGPSAIESPYAIGSKRSQFVSAQSPLRHGSYRGLAATANTFAREAAMDELAELAGTDPLAFRLAHLEDVRLRAVVEASAGRFGFANRWGERRDGVGVGIACGVEKGSYVAACVEVEADAKTGKIVVKEICCAYECGAIINPMNLLSQVEGALIMALGPALREEVKFDNGRVSTASFWKYEVPRHADVPKIDVVLLDRKDLASVGAGETPIIPVAPALAGAVWRATGMRTAAMPVRVVSA